MSVTCYWSVPGVAARHSLLNVYILIRGFLIQTSLPGPYIHYASIKHQSEKRIRTTRNTLQKRNQRNIMYYSQILIIASALTSRSHSSPLHHHQCPHQYSPDLPQQASSWEQFLASKTFFPTVNNERHHMRRLKHKLAELVAVVENTRNDLTQETFADSYRHVDSELEHVNYDHLFHEDYPLENDDITLVYSSFQKLSIASEMILTDLQHHNILSEQTTGVWSVISSLLSSVVKNVYTELLHRPRSPLPSPVTRAFIPPRVRCMPQAAYRDIRDFALLRHIHRSSKDYLRSLE